uniref:Uncharacterized protein n=1 Tax=Arundo donax TaxID=35708 RepID=A0A0A9FF07_ARUDO
MRSYITTLRLHSFGTHECHRNHTRFSHVTVQFQKKKTQDSEKIPVIQKMPKMGPKL